MVQGLQVYDGNGQIVVDVTDNLTSVIDIFNTGTSNGSKQLPSGGYRFWYGVVDESAYDVFDYKNQWDFPKLKLSGNTLSWTFSQTNRRCNPKIIVGIY